MYFDRYRYPHPFRPHRTQFVRIHHPHVDLRPTVVLASPDCSVNVSFVCILCMYLPACARPFTCGCEISQISGLNVVVSYLALKRFWARALTRRLVTRSHASTNTFTHTQPLS